MRPMIFTFAAVLCMASSHAFSQGWLFAGRAGGAGDDYGARIAVDPDGYTYAVGEFSGSASFDTVTLNGSGRWNIYLAKYAPSGRIVWGTVVARSMAPTSDLYASAIAVDRWGDIYIAGRFVADVTFAGSGRTDTSLGYSDMYLAKLSPAGSLLWLRTPGGVGVGTFGQDAINAMALDSSGNCYITGSYNRDARFDTIALASSLTYEIFVAKYDSAGNALWARSGGGSGALHVAQGVAVDRGGNCYITGKFFNALTLGSYTFEAGDAEQKAFIAKADPDGNFLWAGEIGSGGYYGAGQDIAVDRDGNAYVIGQFRATIDLGADHLTYDHGLTYALLLVAYDRDGRYRWSARSEGPDQSVTGVSIDVGAEGNIFAVGRCEGTITLGSTTFVNTAGHGSAFIAELDGSGHYLMADRIVGLGSASPGGMALAPGGDPEIIGSFSDSIQVGSERLRSVGKYDIFIARLGLKSAGVETSTAPPPSLLYPNPARDVVRVRGARAGTRVRVFAIDGGCLLDVDYRDGVDIGGLPRGVYVIEAGGRGGLVVRE